MVRNKEADEAIALAGEQERPIDPVVAKRVLRKLDWFFMPAMTIGCKYLTHQPRSNH